MSGVLENSKKLSQPEKEKQSKDSGRQKRTSAKIAEHDFELACEVGE